MLNKKNYLPAVQNDEKKQVLHFPELTVVSFFYKKMSMYLIKQ